MRIRISELSHGKTIQRISADTGIARRTLTALDRGTAKRVHLVHLDVLRSYFGVPCGALIDFNNSVDYPLKPTIRPDRARR